MKQSAFVYLLVMFNLVMHDVGAVSIKKCDPVAAGEMVRAHKFVTDNIDTILANWESRISTFPSKLQRKVNKKLARLEARYKRKVAKAVLVCQDNKKGCTRNRYLGVANWSLIKKGRGNKVKICYYDHLSMGVSFCNLVNTVAHEIAHKAAIPKQKGHNKNPSPATDPVYQMGNAAQAICNNEVAAGRIVNSSLQGMNNRPIGTACELNDQCATGKCEGRVPDKVCVCRRNSDCSSGQRCRKKGINQCVRR